MVDVAPERFETMVGEALDGLPANYAGALPDRIAVLLDD
jgi:predicted Zn-dependent protease with MMP-like domain